MERYLIKAVDVYRVPNVDAVEELHEELLNDKNFFLAAFSYKHKEIKAKGEVIEEYELVTATKIFADEKEPLDVYEVSYERA